VRKHLRAAEGCPRQKDSLARVPLSRHTLAAATVRGIEAKPFVLLLIQQDKGSSWRTWRLGGFHSSEPL